MINVAISGASGRMGRTVMTALMGEGDMTLSGALEMPGHPALGTPALAEQGGPGEAAERIKITDDMKAALEGADVLIDFSSPEGTVAVIRAAADAKIAAVTGTTGLSDDDVTRVTEASSVIPVVMAPNMSVGVNVLFKIAGEVAAVLGSAYDVEIIEAHHRQKVDAPSGTAKRLYEIIARALERDTEKAGVYGREGMVGKRTTEEIGVMAVRAGDIVGEHTVIFGGIGERIELVHRAHSRMTLASGAVRAARWVIGRQPGMYDMQDVLGLS
ncbi:MAG: 4-hydroxy-tetrahydrodipicolinate reductase [Deltaproteobacteria bacterium]|nr:4-hydroxy-tetrahydrodipicolinate reductase [Candidatus Zymogenaceae bacterium]